jgi:Dolichyl-phosphate-mannose-protein mannosyltransferase
MEQIAEVSEAVRDSLSGAVDADAGQSERPWIIAAGAIVVIQLWLGLIATSFWLDETGTWWIIKDGPGEAVRRSLSWSGQSPLYYLIAWSSSRLFGLNEVALRIPSVLAMSAAVYLVYRIAERLYDRTTAALAAFVFLCIGSYFAIDARPYALAILCLTFSTWALLRWLDFNRPVDALLYVIAGAAVVYAHCVLAVGLAAGVVYAFVATRKQKRRPVWLGLMVAAIALLSLPLMSELKTFYAARSIHTVTSAPALDELLNSVIPASLAGLLILFVWLSLFIGAKIVRPRCSLPAAVLIGTWALFPPVFFFLLAAGTDVRLFVDRYYSSALPGQALLLGGLLSSMQRSSLRKALIVAVAATAILTQGRSAVGNHGKEDWRAAMAFIDKEAGSAPVLLVSSFAEATDFASLRDPKLREILFAPEVLYGEPARSIRLPHVFTSRDIADLEKVAEQLGSARRFYLLTDKPDQGYEFWLMGKLDAQCRPQLAERSFGYIRIARFTCE